MHGVQSEMDPILPGSYPSLGFFTAAVNSQTKCIDVIHFTKNVIEVTGVILISGMAFFEAKGIGSDYLRKRVDALHPNVHATA